MSHRVGGSEHPGREVGEALGAAADGLLEAGAAVVLVLAQEPVDVHQRPDRAALGHGVEAHELSGGGQPRQEVGPAVLAGLARVGLLARQELGQHAEHVVDEAVRQADDRREHLPAPPARAGLARPEEAAVSGVQEVLRPAVDDVVGEIAVARLAHHVAEVVELEGLEGVVEDVEGAWREHRVGVGPARGVGVAELATGRRQGLDEVEAHLGDEGPLDRARLDRRGEEHGLGTVDLLDEVGPEDDADDRRDRAAGVEGAEHRHDVVDDGDERVEEGVGADEHGRGLAVGAETVEGGRRDLLRRLDLDAGQRVGFGHLGGRVGGHVGVRIGGRGGGLGRGADPLDECPVDDPPRTGGEAGALPESRLRARASGGRGGLLLVPLARGQRCAPADLGECQRLVVTQPRAPARVGRPVDAEEEGDVPGESDRGRVGASAGWLGDGDRHQAHLFPLRGWHSGGTR